MATSTLIQKLDSTAFESSKTVPGSYTAISPKGVSHRLQTEVFLASATVAVGDAVAFDLSKTADGDKTLYVIKADTDVATSTCVVGIVLSSAETDGSLTAESKILVLTSGLAEANVDGATVAGSNLTVGATAGQLAVASAAATYPTVAIAVEADTTNVARVLFLKQF